jgi:hypothetical protein
MITDAQTRLAQAQAVTGAAVISQNIYDLLVSGRNIGRGEPMRLIISVDTAFAGGTSLQATFEQSPNPDGSNSTVIGTSPAVPVANLVAGAKLWDVHVPQNAQRYVFVRFTPTGTFTGGAVSANIVHDTDYSNTAPANTGY